MYRSHHYARESVVDLDAAVLGTRRSSWLNVPEDINESDARQLMQTHQFDVLPVGRQDRLSYYITKTWGDFSEINEETLTYDDSLPLTTSALEVIKFMALSKKNFVFLTDEYSVTGLLTIADLNRRQVRTYLFSLLSDLELQLGNLLLSQLQHQGVDADKIRNLIGHKELLDRYEDDVKNGVVQSIVEYLFLPEIIKFLRNEEVLPILGFNSKSKFDAALNPLIELRNQVAHPAKSIISSPAAVGKLWTKIERIERLLFRMRSK